MPLVLTRIDDRLIHGQVVIGWGSQLRPHRIILCNDTVANTDWQREMFNAAGALASEDVKISIWTTEETISYFKQDLIHKERVMLLFESPAEICLLIERGVPINLVNVGGMHFRQGKRQMTPYIFVDDEDLRHFKCLREKNILLEGQDVPTSKKINISSLMDGN
jgi:sorbose PTS system EIIB component